MARDMAVQSADALGAAHEHGAIHRDLNRANTGGELQTGVFLSSAAR